MEPKLLMQLRENPWTSSNGEYASAYLQIFDSHLAFTRLKRFGGGGEDVTVRYDRIAHVALASGWRFAQLAVETTGGGGFLIDGLRKDDAANAKALIDNLVAESATSQAGAASRGSLPDELAQLADLLKQGVLTDTEFEAAKRSLLPPVG